MSKEKDIEYIRKFGSISISKICKKLKVDKSNLYKLKLSEENIKNVKNEIKKQLKELEELEEFGKKR